MTTRLIAASSAAAIAVLLSACGRSSASSMDEGLKQDLAAAGGSSVELAPKSANQQMVVSAIEGGPSSAPARGSTRKSVAAKPIAKQSRQPAQSVGPAVAQSPAPIQAPMPVIPAPTSAETAPVEPAPLPPMQAPVARPATKRQAGPYKTEAEIFREMPWIRP